MLFIYTSCKDVEEAEKLAKLIIENKLGSCVDFWPVRSMYRWEGEIKNITEEMILITTFENKLEDVTDLLSQHHSYSVPFIAGVDIRRINRPYKEWMMEEIENTTI